MVKEHVGRTFRCAGGPEGPPYMHVFSGANVPDEGEATSKLDLLDRFGWFRERKNRLAPGPRRFSFIHFPMHPSMIVDPGPVKLESRPRLLHPFVPVRQSSFVRLDKALALVHFQRAASMED
jgi:hypothetical protein